MRNILLSAFSIPVLKAVVVTWTWTLSFTMGVTIYYYLNALFKTETWNGSFWFSFFNFLLLLFFFKNDQRSFTTFAFYLLYLFLVYVEFYWKKPLSLFSGSCLHYPVHTPILSLYWNQLIKKNQIIIVVQFL